MPCSCEAVNAPVEGGAISFVGDDRAVLVKVVVFLYPFFSPFIFLLRKVEDCDVNEELTRRESGNVSNGTGWNVMRCE